MNNSKQIMAKRVLLVILPVLMLVLSACKIDLTNEVWMNSDNSGRAVIKADVTFPNYLGSLVDSSLTTTNSLQNYIELVDSTQGAKLLSQNIENKSNEEVGNYIYTVEFSFDNLEALNYILASKENPAFTKKKKELVIFPKLFSALSSEDLEDVLGTESLFEIKHHLIFHAPAKLKVSKADKTFLVDKKTIKWDFDINSDWHAKPQAPIKLKY